MMSAKLPSLGLTREEALRDSAEDELVEVSSNRSESESARGDAMKKQRKRESKRRTSC